MFESSLLTVICLFFFLFIPLMQLRSELELFRRSLNGVERTLQVMASTLDNRK